MFAHPHSLIVSRILLFNYGKTSHALNNILSATCYA